MSYLIESATRELERLKESFMTAGERAAAASQKAGQNGDPSYALGWQLGITQVVAEDAMALAKRIIDGLKELEVADAPENCDWCGADLEGVRCPDCGHVDVVDCVCPACQEANAETPVKPAERTIRVPACQEHAGLHYLDLTVPWACLVCGGPRGEPTEAISWDGSRRLHCDGWKNPCGHIEGYSMVREAAVTPVKQ